MYIGKTLSFSVTNPSFNQKFKKMNRYDDSLQNLIGLVRESGTVRENEQSFFGRTVLHNMKAGFPQSTVFPNPYWKELLSNTFNYLKDNKEILESVLEKMKSDPFSNDHVFSNVVFYIRPLSADERTHFWLRSNEMGEMTLDDVRALDHYDEKWTGVPVGALSLLWNQSYTHALDINSQMQFNAFILSMIAKQTNLMPDWLMGNIGTVALSVDDDITEILETESKWLPTFIINDEFDLFADQFDESWFEMIAD